MQKRTKILSVFLVLVLIVFSNTLSFSQSIPEIKFEKYTLSNGLQVILHEDHSTPMVSVNIWYHVGSKNEKRGRTGFAHLFEHLMFEGSEHAPEGMFDKWLEAAGGDNNGSTSEDRTNYWENVPSNSLELALFLESDRLGFLLSAIDQKKLDVQRDVVKNERRQGVDNQPYGKAYEIILQTLYPSDHPYSWTVIGSMEDLSAASLEDVKDFFKRYYTTNNASLCIAGDIDPDETKKLVEKYFGSIPPGPPIDRIDTWVPRLNSVKRIQMADNVSLPRIYISWHSPPLFQGGDAELDVLASILSAGKNSRLYKSLVYEKQIAQDVSAYQDSREISGVFQIVATAKPGHTLAELEEAIDEELEEIFSTPPSAQEVETAVNMYEASFIRQIQSIGGFGGKADKLNLYNVYVGRPDFFGEDLDRYFRVNPESVQSVAQDYIDLNRRTILYVEPAGDLRADETQNTDRNKRPELGPTPALNVPPFAEKVLSNGLRVLVAEMHELPLVQFNLIINAGWAADPTGRPGVSSLTSDLLDEGTKKRDALQISQDLKALGTTLSTSSSFDGSFMSLNTLKKHLQESLDIFSDVLVNPAFPEDELQRKKKIYLARIMQEKKQPVVTGINNFIRTLYGKGHPYSQPYTGTGTEESIQAITKKDLVEYYETYFAPNDATMIVVGDITAIEIMPILEKSLSVWKKKSVPKVNVPSVAPLDKTHIYLIDKPNAPQSVIIAGHLAPPRNSKDYFKLHVANSILGGKFTSRLNMNLREEKGYTYGASSFFMYLKGIGPFIAYTQVHTQFTKESLSEIIKEIRGVRGEIPIQTEELEDTKNYVTRRYPREFETITQIASKLGEIVTYDLPKDYFNRFIPAIEEVDVKSTMSAAEKHLHPDKLLIVVVGDVEKIEPLIRELNLGEIYYMDAEGNLKE